MKRRFLSLLLLVPPLLLVSCKGSKIGDEKAKEIANKITEYTNALEKPSFEVTVKAKGVEGKGDERKEENVSYTWAQDKDENMKLKVKGKDGDENYDFVIYVVKVKEYDTVAYIKEYNVETKAYNEYVYAKTVTEDYSSKTSVYTKHAFGPALLVAALSDPIKFMESDDLQEGEAEDGDGITYNTEINYYSNGEKNLTIEATRKYVKGDVEEGEEITTDYKYSVTYDNLVIKKAVINGKSNLGNTSETKLNIEFKKLTIELPSNWESLLNK